MRLAPVDMWWNLRAGIGYVHTIDPGKPTSIIFSSREVDANLLVPPELDWMGFDCYAFDPFCTDEVVTQQFNLFLSNFVHSWQKMIVVPDSYWGTTPTYQNELTVIQRLQFWERLVASSDQVIGVFPFLYQNDSAESLFGAQSMPEVLGWLQNYFAGLNLSFLSNAVFDADWYLQHNGDLKAAFGNDTKAATNHWLTHGIYEGRQASSSFNVREYLSMNPDVKAFYGAQNYAGAVRHFVTYGSGEGRAGCYALRHEIFNAQWYLQNNADVRAAYGNDLKAAATHWISFGLIEGRQGSSGFSPVIYLANYQDLQNAFGLRNFPAAVHHYIEFGISEGRFGL